MQSEELWKMWLVSVALALSSLSLGGCMQVILLPEKLSKADPKIMIVQSFIAEEGKESRIKPSASLPKQKLRMTESVWLEETVRIVESLLKQI